jgi:hypothetical protein
MNSDTEIAKAFVKNLDVYFGTGSDVIVIVRSFTAAAVIHRQFEKCTSSTTGRLLCNGSHAICIRDHDKEKTIRILVASEIQLRGYSSDVIVLTTDTFNRVAWMDCFAPLLALGARRVYIPFITDDVVTNPLSALSNRIKFTEMTL